MFLRAYLPVLISLLCAVSFLDIIEGSGHTVRRICKNGKPKSLPRSAKKTGKLLSALRDLMVKEGVEAYIVPSGDAHQSEDVAAEHDRRKFISGFSGTHGTAIVTRGKAALWTDGRYFLQAEMEIDCHWILQKEGMPGTPTYAKWLKEELDAHAKVGVDPFLMSVCEWDRISKELEEHKIILVPVKKNLIDLIWKSRPKSTQTPLMVLSLNYAGRTWQDKVAKLRSQLEKKSTSAVVLQTLDEIAWLFNLRGFDISFTPVFFSYALITRTSATLFVDLKKVTPAVRTHLKVDSCLKPKLCVRLEPYDNIIKTLREMAWKKYVRIWLTPLSSQALRMVIPKSKLLLDESPVALPKAIKNPVEIRGMKNANTKDSVAWCEFFAWLEKKVSQGCTELTELTAERKLREFKGQQSKFISLSFATIAGFGPNSAIIHYKSNEFTNVKITNESTFLVDSGGQFLDGTTDTTRTIHLGSPTAHQKDCYTRVLKGHVDIANAVFPNDTYGRTLDVFAREPLWKIGLDYRHGTGHGIGHFLNVHEGPQCIAQGFPLDEEKVLIPGMILSDEPGYYEDGLFGIRLETAVLVVKANTPYHFDGMDYLKFEPVTYVPFDRNLMDTSMLTKSQITWINDYHANSRRIIGQELKRQGKVEALEWLMRATEPITDHS